MADHPFHRPGRVRAKTPDWFRRQGIYVAARDLVTAWRIVDIGHER